MLVASSDFFPARRAKKVCGFRHCLLTLLVFTSFPTPIPPQDHHFCLAPKELEVKSNMVFYSSRSVSLSLCLLFLVPAFTRHLKGSNATNHNPFQPRPQSRNMIINGEITIQDRYPYTVQLHNTRNRRNFFCGASLIGKFRSLKLPLLSAMHTLCPESFCSNDAHVTNLLLPQQKTLFSPQHIAKRNLNLHLELL